MNFHAVIFDLDGTLANTLEDIADNMNLVLSGMGFPTHGYDTFRFFVGDGLKNLVAKCLPDDARTDDMITACHDRMMATYHINYVNKTHLYNGISELLDALTSKGIKMAVLSNKADPLTQKICAVLLKPWKFEIVMGATERFPRKPNPASALFIAEQMGFHPTDICYIGDSDVDMKTAIAAGFYPVGVSWGFRPVEELIQNGAKQIIDSPTELLSRMIL